MADFSEHKDIVAASQAGAQGMALAFPTESRVQEILQENYGADAKPSFQRVRFPTSGAKTYTIPAPDGDEPAEAIEGVVLHHGAARGYWSHAFSGDTPPDCSSVDGRTGTTNPSLTPDVLASIGNPGGLCATCPLNQWGSKRGPDGKPTNGKACKEMRRLWVLRKGDVLPIVVTMPPTSLGAFLDYAGKLSQRGIGMRSVLTRIGLVEAKNRGGIKYAQATFWRSGNLDAETEKNIRALAALLEPTVRAVAVSNEDYRVADEDGVVRD